MSRTLKPEEQALLRSMLEASERGDLIVQLEGSMVTDMKDGGMGSLQFVQDNAQKMGRVLCEAQSKDSDEIPLEISINLDEQDRLFELDIWKVDFSPLRTYPEPSTLLFLNPKL